MVVWCVLSCKINGLPIAAGQVHDATGVLVADPPECDGCARRRKAWEKKSAAGSIRAAPIKCSWPAKPRREAKGAKRSAKRERKGD